MLDYQSIIVKQHLRELQRLGRALELVFVEYKDREAKTRIHGVQVRMQTFDYFFGLRLGILLLRYSDHLSKSLLAENLCTTEAQKIAKSTVNTLKKMRSDEKFNLS